MILENNVTVYNMRHFPFFTLQIRILSFNEIFQWIMIYNINIILDIFTILFSNNIIIYCYLMIHLGMNRRCPKAIKKSYMKTCYTTNMPTSINMSKAYFIIVVTLAWKVINLVTHSCAFCS